MSASDGSAGRIGAGATRALILLTALNFLNYVDRYVLAAVLEPLRATPAFSSVTESQAGLLQSAFLIVYTLFAPLAGLAGRRVPRWWIVAGGGVLWSLATVASGLARTYPQLLVARALIGFGEAGYATVAPAILSDLFPRERRNRALTIFYVAIPVGSALGFVLGGAIAQAAGWRTAFLAAGGPGIALALLALTMNEPMRGGLDTDGDAAAQQVPLRDGLRALARSSTYLTTTAGMTLYTFSVGGLAFWLPTWFQRVHHVSVGAAGIYVGGVAVLSGILGTFVGGWLGDEWARRDALRTGRQSAQPAYLRLSAIGLLAGAPLALAAPFVPSLSGAIALFFLAELGVFLNTGPLNSALVNAAPPSVRELAVGLNVLAMHLLGDALSPPLLGAIAAHAAHRGLSEAAASGFAIALVALPLLVGGAVLLLGARAAARTPR